MTPDRLRQIPLVLREGGSGTLEVFKTAVGKAGIRIPEVNVVLRLGSTEGIKAFVRNSDAMAIVSVASIVDELRSGELRIIDIEGCTIRREFSFCWPEGRSDALAATGGTSWAAVFIYLGVYIAAGVLGSFLMGPDLNAVIRFLTM